MLIEIYCALQNAFEFQSVLMFQIIIEINTVICKIIA